MTETKACKKCGECKPATTEYYSLRSKKTGKLRGSCKVCEAEHKRQYYQENKDAITKRCRQYYQENKEYYAEYDRQRRQENKDAIAEYNRQHYQENKEYYAGYKRQHYQENKEYYAEYARQYRQENRDKMRVHDQRYIARKNSLPDTFTDEHCKAMLEYFNHACAVCKRPFDLFTGYELDHWLPIDTSISGVECPGTVVTNMVPLCGNRHGFNGYTGCNPSKSNKHPETWLIEVYGNRNAKKILKRINDYFKSVDQN